ncbi:MAG: hypothetical protein NVS3B26_29090 [Mycobacteriales bacterium]
MRLEGTLDAFSLPDIFQLLSYTKKTGTLHLRRAGNGGEEAHGVVHLRDGAVTGARADVRRQALGRRIIGAGVVDDVTLAEAVARVERDSSCGLARALTESGSLSEEFARALAAEQAADAVFDLLRWPEGEFAFMVDEPDPDDLGAALSVDEVVAEGQRRMQAWAEAVLPPAGAVLALAPTPSAEPAISRDEWSLLSFVDGRRTVADLVMLSGRGEYVVVSALAGLIERGLLTVAASPQDAAHRSQLLGRLEGIEEPTASDAARHPTSPSEDASTAAAGGPEPSHAGATGPAGRPGQQPQRGAAPGGSESPPARGGVIPERPEPFTPPRQPEHGETPAYARVAGSAPRAAVTVASVGDVHGATAMQPSPDAPPAPYVERDPSVNKSLLLRLIAGVRGL